MVEAAVRKQSETELGGGHVYDIDRCERLLFFGHNVGNGLSK